MSLPDPARHKDQRNFFESVLRKIPGFRGYLEKEYRRESDRLAREWMVGRLRQAKTGLDDLMRGLVDAGQVDALPQLDRVRARLDHFISALLAAMSGYSGLFDFVKINEQSLDEVYELDATLMEEVDRFAASLQQLGAKPDSPAAVASDLLSRIDDLQRKLLERNNLLKGLGGDDPS
jgi:hypothetical protein